MPAPKTSNHPENLQERQPFPSHCVQAMSISTEGSVKGK